jgi:hypothetical protein
MDVVGVVFGVIGVLLAAYFGIRSLFQSSDMEALQRALRAYNQAMFNNLTRIGGRGEEILKLDELKDDLKEAKRFATGITEMTQAARHWVNAFSREQAQFVPSYEAAWEPKELPPQAPKRFLRRFLFV